MAATELAATGTSGFGGVLAAGGGAWPPWPKVVAVNEVTNAASAMAATNAVDLVVRCIANSWCIAERPAFAADGRYGEASP